MAQVKVFTCWVKSKELGTLKLHNATMFTSHTVMMLIHCKWKLLLTHVVGNHYRCQKSTPLNHLPLKVVCKQTIMIYCSYSGGFSC